MDRHEPEIFTDNLLKLAVVDGKETIEVKWLGKSIQREPGRFIAPILTGVIEKSNGLQKKIVFDFRELAYMNSSTLTPVIKVLDRAQRGSVQLAVIYDKSIKWQDLNFSALSLFETKDRRIEVKGL